MFPYKDAGRVVFYAFADDDLAANIDEIEHPENRITRGFVRFLLFATAQPRQGVERRVFCRADEFKLDGAFGIGGRK